MRSALLLLALFAGGAIGCANNDASLSIIQMQAVTESTSCVATSTASVELSRGVLDVSFITSTSLQGYIGFPIVRNNEQSRKPSADSPELNSIQLIGANVSLTFPDPTVGKNVPAADRKFFWAASGGRIDPLGAAPMQIEVVPIKVVNELIGAAQASGLVSLTAEIQPVGMQTSDRIVGGPIFFPVDLCNGCLYNPIGTCPLAAGSTVVATCISGQDQVANCCDGSRTCGANVPILKPSIASPQSSSN
jgi:hypothetical protein